jgi:hypothetical protein
MLLCNLGQYSRHLWGKWVPVVAFVLAKDHGVPAASLSGSFDTGGNPAVALPCMHLLFVAAILLAVWMCYWHAAHLDANRQPQLRALQGRGGRQGKMGQTYISGYCGLLGFGICRGKDQGTCGLRTGHRAAAIVIPLLFCCAVQANEALRNHKRYMHYFERFKQHLDSLTKEKGNRYYCICTLQLLLLVPYCRC